MDQASKPSGYDHNREVEVLNASYQGQCNDTSSTNPMLGDVTRSLFSFRHSFIVFSSAPESRCGTLNP